MRRSEPTPLDGDPNDALTFDDVTTLAFLVACCASLAVVILLGVLCAMHRIEAVVELL